MILDTSALLAIILGEPDYRRFAKAISGARVVRLSAASYVEAAICLERRGDEVQRAMLDAFLTRFSIEMTPVTVEQAREARQAFRLFGKGLHPAALNFGDCFTYALAKAYGEPVLFKGRDFLLTDLEAAVTPDETN